MMTAPSFRFEGFRLRYARFGPDQRLTWPTKVPARLCVFLAGNMRKSLPSREHIFGENDVLYEPPEERPRLCFGPNGAGTLTVEFDSAAAQLLGPIGFPADRPFALRSAHCTALARKILREMISTDALTTIALQGLTLQLLVEIMRRKNGTRRGVASWLREVHERILNSADQPVRVRELARAAGVHPAHLAQVFRVTYGESVSQMARRKRVEQASRSLAGTDKPLVQIALESGFCDQSHFCRVFRNVTGFTPMEFRRMFKQP